MPKLPPEDEFVAWCRKLGIDPSTVQVVRVAPSPKGRERFGAPPDQNVVPFPKSGNAREFGRRKPKSPSVREVLVDALREIDSGMWDPNIIILLQAERDSGTRLVHSSGLNRYESVGFLQEAAHDFTCGHMDDDGDAA